MQEEWVAVSGYEGRYEVSSCGRVRSIAQPGTQLSGKILAPIKTHGYLYVTLCKDKTKKRFAIHRLVAVAFIQNPNNKPTVNHKDGNKSNNKVKNLEWVTSSENNKHAFAKGLTVPYCRKGKNNPMFGKHHSESAKEKIASVHKGLQYSPAAKAKMSAAHKGKKFSEEHKQKLSQSLKRAKLGTKWVNDGKEQRIVKPEIASQLVKSGWKYGKLK